MKLLIISLVKAMLFRSVKNLPWGSKTNSSVMLVESTGSGKEVFARAIHDHGNRVKGPFLALNCAAIPESLIEGILLVRRKGYTPVLWKRKVSWPRLTEAPFFLMK